MNLARVWVLVPEGAFLGIPSNAVSFGSGCSWDFLRGTAVAETFEAAFVCTAWELCAQQAVLAHGMAQLVRAHPQPCGTGLSVALASGWLLAWHSKPQGCLRDGSRGSTWLCCFGSCRVDELWVKIILDFRLS